jgi:ribosomal protein S18 acetylase RimI-like enzyme
VAPKLSIDQLSFRQAGAADIPFLLALREQTMVQHQLASGVEASQDERIQRVQARFDCAQILSLAERPVGLLKVVREGSEWELVQIQLIPELHGAGLGTKLVERVIAEARSARASLRLMVLRANPARRLYERLGFVVTREGPHSFDMHLAAAKDR